MLGASVSNMKWIILIATRATKLALAYSTCKVSSGQRWHDCHMSISIELGFESALAWSLSLSFCSVLLRSSVHCTVCSLPVCITRGLEDTSTQSTLRWTCFSQRPRCHVVEFSSDLVLPWCSSLLDTPNHGCACFWISIKHCCFLMTWHPYSIA